MPDYRCSKNDPKPPIIGNTYNAIAAALNVSREVQLVGYVGRTPDGREGGPSALWRVRDKRTGRTFLVEPWMIGALEPRN